ncbi:hypothetical protein ACFO9Q_01890 [Paenibacillus sp. GCM10023252]|uniref:HAAS signaling domain-containing protein n=1 Tax=Paenibacillus sp. GCM10023252 TaxID=3252649 RepID=UPI00360FDB80
MMKTRQRYMQELDRYLSKVPEHLRREMLMDYEMHFQMAVEDGKSEEQAAAELGDPRVNASELLLNYRVEQAETNNNISSLSKAVFATLGLGLFNAIFVLGPYAGLLAVILALWSAVLALGAAGIGVILDSIWNGNLTMKQAVSLALIVWGLAILLGLGLNKLTKVLYTSTLRYLKFNTRLVRGRQG